MTASTRTRPAPGDTFHVLRDGLSIATSPSIYAEPIALTRGRVVTLTAAMIDSTIDRNGDSWLDLLHDPAGQVERWGERKIAPGPWPEGLDRFERGSVPAMLERDRLRAAASTIADERERAQALRDIDARLGRPPGQVSTWYAGDEERARERERERRLDRGLDEEGLDDA